MENNEHKLDISADELLELLDKAEISAEKLQQNVKEVYDQWEPGRVPSFSYLA